MNGENRSHDPSKRMYPVIPTGAKKEPDYARVVGSMTVQELVDDKDRRLGTPEYQQAVIAELAYRGHKEKGAHRND